MKSLHKILLFCLASIFLFYSNYSMSYSLVSCNPLPAYWDTSPEGIPLPVDYEDLLKTCNNTVYLYSESLNVSFSYDVAKINASYTFKNLSPNNTQLQIGLPFVDVPRNLQITILKENISYKELIPSYGIDIPVNSSLEAIKSITPRDLAAFELAFEGYEEITIDVRYERSYAYQTNYPRKKFFYYNEFRYIIGSARWWNHTIKHAYFEFRIDLTEFDSGGVNSTSFLEAGSISAEFNDIKTSESIIFTRTYIDWLPNDEVYFKVYWLSEKPFSIPYPTMVTFVTIGFLLLRRKR